MPAARKENTGIRSLACSPPPLLRHSGCEPLVQIESCKSLKLVRNLRGIVVRAIRVIDCLDALSACIISHRLWPGLGPDPGAKMIESGRNEAWGERIKPVMSDKILHFPSIWKSSDARKGGKKKGFFKGTCRRRRGIRGIWFGMIE